MGDIVYNALNEYYKVLGKTGYLPYKNAEMLLVLSFCWEFVYNDYSGRITEEDYHLIEKALNCLYGKSCLIPYPDYLKMGKLHLSEVTDLACRVKALEDKPVVKVVHAMDGQDDPDSEVLIIEGDVED
jgi:hypothetical protein